MGSPEAVRAIGRLMAGWPDMLNWEVKRTH